MVSVFVRSCENTLKFNAVVKWLAFWKRCLPAPGANAVLPPVRKRRATCCRQMPLQCMAAEIGAFAFRPAWLLGLLADDALPLQLLHPPCSLQLLRRAERLESPGVCARINFFRSTLLCLHLLWAVRHRLLCWQLSAQAPAPHLLWCGHAKAPSHPHITSLCLMSPALLIPVPTSPSHPLVPGGLVSPCPPVFQL